MGPVADGFKVLLESLEPLSYELEAAASHAGSIKARLSASFDLKRFEIIGSHARRSAIAGYSDVDYLAMLGRDEVRWGGSIVASTTVQNRVRAELIDRFKDTYVRKNGPAVVVHFSGGEFPVDVVPAYFLGPHQTGWPLYGIPDGADGWMQTSPGYHNKYIGDADARCMGRLHQVAKLLKCWRDARSPSIPISSFHMEMLLAAEAICDGYGTHRECLAACLRKLCTRGAAALRDPLKVSGNIVACRTEAQREQTVIALEAATDWADRALNAEGERNEDDACELWNRLFNGDFPLP
jgi:hypothetical protein